MPPRTSGRMRDALQEQTQGPPGLLDPVEALLAAIQKAPASSAACRAAAERFSEAAFISRLRLQIEETLAQSNLKS